MIKRLFSTNLFTILFVATLGLGASAASTQR
jgi:hypothetical protein